MLSHAKWRQQKLISGLKHATCTHSVPYLVSDLRNFPCVDWFIRVLYSFSKFAAAQIECSRPLSAKEIYGNYNLQPAHERRVGFLG